MRIFILVHLVFLLLPSYLFSQDTTLIRLIQADEIKYNKHIMSDIQVLAGQVILEHDSIFLYCDSAYLNEKMNNVEAFGNVHFKASDTLHLFGDHLIYDGNTKIAEIRNNVRLIDRETTLTTEHLFYNRLSRTAQYIAGGKIINKDNELYSDIGYYFSEKKEFLFRKNVILVNPRYIMKSENLKYNTESETAHFLGPTTIESSDTYIYCENGWYDTRNDISQYDRNANIVHGEQSMKGDSLYYDQKLGFGKGFNHVVVTDTVQDIIIKGNYAEYRKPEGYSMVTDSAVAILISESDSLFLHADTLRATFDSTQNIRSLYAYNRCKFYRTDIQGMCDSLYYNFTDSVISLYIEPVLWSEQYQLTADSIQIWIRNKQLSMMILHNTAFIIGRDAEDKYNQIRGINMTGYFTDNELTNITVASNAETIYYVREDDGGLIGINKVFSGNMKIQLSDNKIQKITYIDKPTATLYPENEVKPEDLRLKGFKWLGNRRPSNKFDIFFE
jgi:lipopolysaccharide export system protein LptA